MSQKNILVLVEHFGQGGAERVAAMLAQLLHDSGRYNVWLYAIHNAYPPPPSGAIKTGTLGIGYAGGLRKVGNYLLKIRRLNALKREVKSDVTISSLWPVDWMNALTGRDRRIGIIQINILNNPQNAMMVRLRSIVSKVYRRFDKVVVGGANLIPELTDYFHLPKERLEVILNPVETKRVARNMEAPLPEKLQAPFGRYRVCVAANRLVAIKNTGALVPIFQSLTDQQGTRFLIIGEGEEKPAIEAAITAAGLRYSQVDDAAFDETAHFWFLNFQQNIHNIIGRSALFLFPTQGEGLPLALLEAMTCGVPVVVSDCPNGGISEVLNPGTPYDPVNERQESLATGGGYLMPIPSAARPAHVREWKLRIEELLAADEETLQSMRRHNQARAAEFDTTQISHKWVRLIEEVMNP